MYTLQQRGPIDFPPRMSNHQKCYVLSIMRYETEHRRLLREMTLPRYRGSRRTNPEYISTHPQRRFPRCVAYKSVHNRLIYSSPFSLAAAPFELSASEVGAVLSLLSCPSCFENSATAAAHASVKSVLEPLELLCEVGPEDSGVELQDGVPSSGHHCQPKITKQFP